MKQALPAPDQAKRPMKQAPPAPDEAKLHKPSRQRRYAVWLGFCHCLFVENPMVSTNKQSLFFPRIISKVLFWGIMIPTLIKAVTFTYIIIDIYIIICINITSK